MAVGRTSLAECAMAMLAARQEAGQKPARQPEVRVIMGAIAIQICDT